MADTYQRCNFCKLPIMGKAAYLNGVIFHHACYMWRQYGIRAGDVPPEQPHQDKRE